MKLSGKAVLYMALVFASGAVLGVVGNRSYTAYTAANNPPKGKGDKNRGDRRFTPEEYRRSTISFFQRRLDLTDEQATQLGIIMDETRSKFEELQTRMQPEQVAIGAGQTDRIRAMLNEEQRTEFEVLLKEREERDKNKRKGDRRGGGPGF